MPATHTADCPPERLIVDFSRGKLDDAAAETVSAHLETCIDCRAAADRVAADSFIRRLRAAHGQIFAAAPLCSQADSVSRANSATVTFKASAPQVSPSTPATFSVPPELVDHPDYEVVKELGRGGMGVVYLARNRAMDRLEVLKVVSRSLLEKADARERFQREIRSAAKLSHPNIVTAHSVPRAGDLLIFAMEYIEGLDLSQVVKQRGQLPVVNAAYYAHQAALGLQHAHEHGMVHRDIKPNNLILSVRAKRHLIKILDFGLAKASSEKFSNSELTASGQMLGTPDYVAPEQSLDAHEADIRADIYSLGCTLYHMLAGRPPFEGPSLYALLAAHHSNSARPLSEVRSDVPAELAAVVAKMMAKDPAHRFQTPADVSAALGPFYRASGGEAAKLMPMAEEAVSRDTPPEVFDPHYQWLGIAPEEQPVDHYRLLGAKRFEPNPEVIANLADQRAAHLRSFQRGEHAALAQKLLGEAAAARVCLLNADRKAVYDAELRRSIATRPQALPPIAAPLALPLAAVGAPVAASPALSELSPARKAAAWAKRAMASLPTRLGVHRLPRAVIYTALGSFAALIVLCVVIIKLSTPDGELTVAINKSNADQVVTIEQDGHKVLTAKLEPSAKTTPAQPPPKATESEHQGSEPRSDKPLALHAPGFQQWVDRVAAMEEPEQRVFEVMRKLSELNPGFEGKETHVIHDKSVWRFSFSTDRVSDISPVRALAELYVLECAGSAAGSGRLSDLSPLRGMRLGNLVCNYTRISDLSPLAGMRLSELSIYGDPVSDLSPIGGMHLLTLVAQDTQIDDLSPLKGMPISCLNCERTRVADLSPLAGAPMTTLFMRDTRVADLSALKGMELGRLSFTLSSATKNIEVLRPMQKLKNIIVGTTAANRLFYSDAEFWKKYDAGEFGKPDSKTAAPDRKPTPTFNDPAFIQWAKGVATLPAGQQVDAVAKKLRELNPGFDRKLTDFDGHGTPKIEHGVVTDLGFSTDNVSDISPVRAFAGLKSLAVAGSWGGRDRFSDLLPLNGMPLTRVWCAFTQVSDLTPLNGMPLVELDCGGTQVSDLSPLKGLRLEVLRCGYTPASDLSPLTGMALRDLVIDGTKVSDLSPLQGMSISTIGFTPKNITNGLDVIRRMKSIKTIGVNGNREDQLPPDEFWKKYDAGEFK